MQAAGRSRRRRRRRRTDAYLVCVGSVAAFSALVAMGVLIASPRWDSPILGVPLGAFLTGGLGGMLTQIGSPARSRRLGSRQPSRVAALTIYRLASACLLGGLGHALLTASARASGLILPAWLLMLGAVAFGVTEMLINGWLLRGLGLLPAGPEAGPP